MKLKTDQNTCCFSTSLSTSIIYLLWKNALIYILMFCIWACALCVLTQQNALCHTHLTYETQSLSENLRVGEERNRMNTVSPIVLCNALDFKSLTVTQLNSIFVSLPISHEGELNLQCVPWVCLWTILCFNALRFQDLGRMCKFWVSVCSFTLFSVTSGQVGGKKRKTKPFSIRALSKGTFCNDGHHLWDAIQ